MKQSPIQIMVLEPEEGYVLTNMPLEGADEDVEYSYSLKVYIGSNDSAENWREIPEGDVPEGVVL